MLPNFLIIGAGRTGTTSLYHYLKQHPDIFMSDIKEPRFFAYEDKEPKYSGPLGQVRLNQYSTNLNDYKKLFADVSDEVAIGEASVDYFYIPDAAKCIKKYIPDVKIILILRHPVDRAYSQFWARVALGIEPLTDFSKAMEQEEERIKDNWPPQYHYKQKSFYSASLKRYYELFDKDQVKIFLHEEYSKDPSKVIQDITDFLGVDSSFSPDIEKRYNLPRGLAKYAFLNRIVKRHSRIKSLLVPLLPSKAKNYLREILAAKNFLPRPPLDLEVRKKLTAIYTEDIIELQSIIHRDLSGWLK